MGCWKTHHHEGTGHLCRQNLPRPVLRGSGEMTTSRGWLANKPRSTPPLIADSLPPATPTSVTCRLIALIYSGDMVARGRVEVRTPRCRMLTGMRWTTCVTGGPAVLGAVSGRGAACWLARSPPVLPPLLPIPVSVPWWPAAYGLCSLRGAACFTCATGLAKVL